MLPNVYIDTLYRIRTELFNSYLPSSLLIRGRLDESLHKDTVL